MEMGTELLLLVVEVKEMVMVMEIVVVMVGAAAELSETYNSGKSSQHCGNILWALAAMKSYSPNLLDVIECLIHDVENVHSHFRKQEYVSNPSPSPSPSLSPSFSFYNSISVPILFSILIPIPISFYNSISIPILFPIPSPSSPPEQYGVVTTAQYGEAVHCCEAAAGVAIVSTRSKG